MALLPTIVPNHSSERQEYIPTRGHVGADVIATHAAAKIVCQSGPLLDFAVMTSRHMRLWTESVAGRLESRIRFANTLCWNTFVLPHISDALRTSVDAAAQAVLDAREDGVSLAEQYDPDRMPEKLRAAHLRELDGLLDEVFGPDFWCR